MFVEVEFTDTAKLHMQRTGAQPYDLTGDVFTGLTEMNPARAAQQLAAHYTHGGGWNPRKGFTLAERGETAELLFPGDPPMVLIAKAKLRDETVMLFDCSWVCVVQANGDFEVSRMD